MPAPVRPTFPIALAQLDNAYFIPVLVGMSMLIAESIMFVRLYALSGRNKFMLAWICVQLIVRSAHYYYSPAMLTFLQAALAIILPGLSFFVKSVKCRSSSPSQPHRFG